MFAPQSIPAAPPASTPQTAEPADGAAAYWSREAADARAALRVERLQVMGRLGLDLIARLHELVLSGEAGPELGAAFVNLSRAVRQTVALEAKLDIDADARAAQAAAEREKQAARRTAAAAERQRARRETVQDVVETEIQTTVDAEREPARAEGLYDSLHERLDDPDDTAGIADRPLSLVITDICATLGIEPDLSLWVEEDWALDEAIDREPGSPFMAVRDGPDAILGEYRAMVRPSWTATQGSRAPP